MRRIKTLAFLALVVFTFTIRIQPVHAKEIRDLTQEDVFTLQKDYTEYKNDGIVTNYESEIVLNEKGDAEITETIVVYFPTSKRGIIRWIPNYLEEDSLHKILQPITVLDVSYYKLEGRRNSQGPLLNNYTESKEGAGYTVLRIGEEYTYIDGAYVYTIKYKMKDAILIFDDYQELYLNINGPDWTMPILSTKAIVHNTKNIEASHCFTGQIGSVESDCVINESEGSLVFESDIPRGTNLYNLTIGIMYTKDTFTGPTQMEQALEYTLNLLPFIILILGFLYGYAEFQKYGKDKNISAVPPQFVVPEELKVEDLSVLQALLKMREQKVNVLAELVKIAEKRFLSIKYEKRKIFLNVSPTQKTKLKEYIVKQPSYIISIVNALTQNLSSSTDIKNLSNVYYKMEAANKSVANLFRTSKFIDQISRKKRSLFIFYTILAFSLGGIGVFLFAELVPLRAMYWAFSMFLLGVTYIFFTVNMFKRTPKGDDTLMLLLGLKRYIKTAEIERLEFFNDPKKMIAHFEEILPFAIILGLDKKWTRLFGPILKKLEYEPKWMSSDIPLYRALPRTYASMSSSMGSYVNHISTPPQSSGSSFSSGGGFSSGGFSGGGSGGGGGSSW